MGRDGSALARVLDFQRRSLELAGGRVTEIPEGWVVRTPAMPVVWVLNHVRLRTAPSYERAVELIEQHLAGAGFRQLYVDDERPGGGRLAEAFQADGWEVDGELHSMLVRPPDRRVGTSAVTELTEEEALALMSRWLREDETLHLDDEAMRQLIENHRLTWRARNAVRLGVRAHDGSPTGMTLVLSGGGVAQVEDVYVVPEARGGGSGRALVTRAIDVARELGPELVFIVADDNDWPKQLYARLGFEPLGRTWMFHRQVPEERAGG